MNVSERLEAVSAALKKAGDPGIDMLVFGARALEAELEDTVTEVTEVVSGGGGPLSAFTAFTLWSHHDAPELALAVVAERERLRARVAELERSAAEREALLRVNANRIRAFVRAFEERAALKLAAAATAPAKVPHDPLAPFAEFKARGDERLCGAMIGTKECVLREGHGGEFHASKSGSAKEVEHHQGARASGEAEEAATAQAGATQAEGASTAIGCAACGQPCEEFTVPNEAWNELIRDGGKSRWGEYLCLNCFALIAAGKLRAAREALAGKLPAPPSDLSPVAEKLAAAREAVEGAGMELAHPPLRGRHERLPHALRALLAAVEALAERR